MSANSFGHHFTCITWGESHGPAIGCVLDGVPAQIKLCEQDIQPFLDQRKPGQSRFVTQRRELDQVKILSGVFEGVTTGTPIALMIENTDTRTRDYSDIINTFRPGHADITYLAKYGIRDYRGGGRSSARETAMRVAAGAVARKILQQVLTAFPIIEGCVVELGGDSIAEKDNLENISPEQWLKRFDNPFWCPDPNAAMRWEKLVDNARKKGDSVGALVAVRCSNMPIGLGQPIYHKLDSELASAMMSINAVKSVEIGSGIQSARLNGSQNSDQIGLDQQGKLHFESNHAGGVLGGISTGQDLCVRLSIKPTSSILHPMRSVDTTGKATKIVTKGRHDPCVGIRAVPVAEAMMACVLADALLAHRSQMGAIGCLPFTKK